MMEAVMRMLTFEIDRGMLRRVIGEAAQVTVPEGVRRICSTAFQGAGKTLESLILPEGVEEISEDAE